MIEPPKGFYVAVARLEDGHGEYMRFLAGPFRQWSDASAVFDKAAQMYRNDYVNLVSDFPLISMLQCEMLPQGVLNAKLWVDKAKLVS